MQEEVAPHDERWQEQGYADKEVWRKAGANGFLCPSMPPEYGGAGADKLYSVVLIEEQARANNSTLGFGLHSEIVAPYLLAYGTEPLKNKYLPKLAPAEVLHPLPLIHPRAATSIHPATTTPNNK